MPVQNKSGNLSYAPRNLPLFLIIIFSSFPQIKKTEVDYLLLKIIQSNRYYEVLSLLKSTDLVWFCSIIAEWFFYINHFSLVVFYHSVWLGFELFGSSCRCTHIEYSSRSRAEDMTIRNVIIKTPDRKWDWSVNDVMSWSDGLRIWWFWKRVNWDPTLGRACPARGYGMRSAFVGSDSTVSIERIVSLSPRVEKLKSRS